MCDGTGKRGLAWQTSQDSTQDATKVPVEATETTVTKQQANPPAAEVVQPTNETLLEQAFKFIKDPSIVDAPLEQKIAFLESKGISKESIGKVLDTTQPKPEPLSTQTLDPLVRHDLSVPASTNALPHDIPPIITYPEFLMKPQKPPPIITAQRLLNTAYLFGGAATLIYGLSKYLIGPMTESLTFARHEFAQHSQKQVDELNERLKEVVSVDPSIYRDTVTKGDDAVSVADSSDSDPTELYHRDFGTQTLPLPAASDTSSSDAGDEVKDSLRGDGTDAQASLLLQMKNRFEELRSEYDVEEQSTHAEISTMVKVLNEHLESLAYPTSSYHGMYGGGDSGKKDDEIGRVKAEIRGVKGVLLSARNFKAPTRGTFGTSTGS